MSLASHKKNLYFASIIIAFIFVLNGLNDAFVLPFSWRVKPDHPVAYGYDKNSMVIVDKQSKRMMRLDEKGRVVNIMNLKKLRNAPKVIKDVFVDVDEMYIMGCDMYNDGSHILSERIEHYTLDGKYLGNVYSEYVPEKVFRNRAALCSMTVRRGNLYVSRIMSDRKSVQVYNLTDMVNVRVVSAKLDVPIVAAYYDADGKRLAIADVYNRVHMKVAENDVVPGTESEFFRGRAEHSAIALTAFKKAIDLQGEMPLSNAIYKILYDDGCGLPDQAHFLRQHTDMYNMNFSDGKVTQMGALPIVPGMLLYQFLYFVAVVWLVFGFLRVLAGVIKNGFYDGLNRCMAVFVLCCAIVGMNAYNTYNTLERECVEKLDAISNIMTYDVNYLHPEIFEKMGKDGISEYCKNPANKKTIESFSDRITALIESFGQTNGFYAYMLAFDNDGTLYTITDSSDDYPVGFHFGKITSAKFKERIQMPIRRGKDYMGRYISNFGTLSSNGDDGITIAFEVGFYTNALVKRSVIIAARNFFDKYSIFLVLWLCGLILSLVRKDIAKHNDLKKSSDTAFANIPFTRINTVVMGFLLGLDEIMFIIAVQRMYPELAIGQLAIKTSVPMLLMIVTAIASNNIIPFVRCYLDDKKIGAISSVISALSYLMLAIAVNTKDYMLLCAGKALIGFFLAGTFNFMIYATLNRTGGDDVRKSYSYSYYQSKTIGTLLGIMASGYIVTVWDFKGLYLFASCVAFFLLCLSCLAFLPETQGKLNLDKGQMKVAVQTFASKDVMLYLCCILIPAFAMLGFKEYVFPPYATLVGCSPLLISNIVAFIQGFEYAMSSALGKVVARFNDRMTIFYAVFLLGLSSLCFTLHQSLLMAAVLMFIMVIAMSVVTTGGGRYFKQVMLDRHVPDKVGTQLHAQLRSLSHIATVIPLYIVNLSPHYVTTITGAIVVVLSLLFLKKTGGLEPDSEKQQSNLT